MGETLLTHLEQALREADDRGNGEWYCVYGSDDDEETFEGRTKEYKEAESRRSSVLVKKREKLRYEAPAMHALTRQRRQDRAARKAAAEPVGSSVPIIIKEEPKKMRRAKEPKKIVEELEEKTIDEPKKIVEEPTKKTIEE